MTLGFVCSHKDKTFVLTVPVSLKGSARAPTFNYSKEEVPSFLLLLFLLPPPRPLPAPLFSWKINLAQMVIIVGNCFKQSLSPLESLFLFRQDEDRRTLSPSKYRDVALTHWCTKYILALMLVSYALNTILWRILFILILLVVNS